MTVTGIETGVRQFQEDGFMVARGLFARDEIDRLCGEFTALHSGGPVPGHFEPSAPGESTDPLRRYPRVMQPHEINDLALHLLLDARLREVLETLLGEEVLAAQSMFYFAAGGAGAGAAPGQLLSAGRTGHLCRGLGGLRCDRPGQRRS